MTNKPADIEEGLAFTPKFDANGLITVVVTDAKSGDVLMVAHMNEEAMQKNRRERRSLVLQPLTQDALEKRRDVRPYAARRRIARRL